MIHPPLGVYLSAFERMLSKTARNRSGSARTLGRSELDPSTQRDALSLGLSLDSPQRFGKHRRSVHGLEIESKLAGLDASQVQELVNGLSQLLDADQRGRDELPLSGRVARPLASCNIRSVILSVVSGVCSSCDATATAPSAFRRDEPGR